MFPILWEIALNEIRIFLGELFPFILFSYNLRNQVSGDIYREILLLILHVPSPPLVFPNITHFIAGLFNSLVYRLL